MVTYVMEHLIKEKLNVETTLGINYSSIKIKGEIENWLSCWFYHQNNCSNPKP